MSLNQQGPLVDDSLYKAFLEQGMAPQNNKRNAKTSDPKQKSR